MKAPPPPATENPTFDSLGLKPELVEALTTLGYEEPTPIQAAALPPLLAGKDLLGIAATGTGKTAAFALPLLQHLTAGAAAPHSTSALVLVPTRELAMQVSEAIHRYGTKLGVSVLPLYGGQEIGRQLRVLKRGVDVVVATPGRALDHLRRKTLKLDNVHTVVLDEADEMLDMGFADDLEAILSETPEKRQTALFSATLPPRIASIAERHLRNPERVRIAKEKLEAGEMPRVRQTAYIVPRAFKIATLGRVLDLESPTAAIVFCRTRTEVDELTTSLNGRGWRAHALHGGMSQEQRDRVIKQFKSQQADLLIATDVAARGLDIPRLSHVVNFDVPNAPEAYVHRIGRTGRAGREGVAITLLEPREHRLLRNIERLTGQRIEVSAVPTVSDLRARRLEMMRSSLREALVEGELEAFRGIVEDLSGEFSVMDVAAAAVKLLQEKEDEGKDAAEQDIPQVSAPSPSSEKRFPRSGPPSRGGDRPERAPRPRTERTASTEAGGERAERPARPPRAPEWNVTRLFIGAGRTAGMRPADLVGAIAGEAGLDSSRIGAIHIADMYSIVEVPEPDAARIISALKGATLRGKKVSVRRDTRD
ncbi:DEAD/DEAH box helicase [Corallococcus llansteffanensis]|uniref:DEAD-box ATP-dependent RNA helicase RhpA n=1 Tax=Corallococcus llansteffanensis TaxID=2316731 RepID=A0A3A8QGY4_9BACT|nr:DEAD/DEAH box helicase [Corallococcus llansteffanensis]RKH64152.1 DEAD/DEAH box helicase [Corallococcus llansteffanensis]